jgi:hypothetical protein
LYVSIVSIICSRNCLMPLCSKLPFENSLPWHENDIIVRLACVVLGMPFGAGVAKVCRQSEGVKDGVCSACCAEGRRRSG